MRINVWAVWLRLPVAVVVLLLSQPGYAAGPMFMGLGDLPGGSFNSRAFGVSADGSTVVGLGTSPHPFVAAGEFEAFRWTSGDGMVGLGYLPEEIRSSFANGVSADGSTVAGISGEQAFRWTSGGGMVGLGWLDPSLGDDSRARGISADGSTIVGWSGGEAFRWTSGGGMVGLGYLPGQPGFVGSDANGVSADGSTIVGISGTEAFRWSSGDGMVGLGDLPGGSSSIAFDISGDGSTIVGSSGTEAFRWTNGDGMVGLGDLPGGGFGSTARGVSADGSTIVGQGSNAAGAAAFIWDETHGMRELALVLSALGLDLTGWDLHRAYAISADGLTIVGAGDSPDGGQAWIATIPEPSTALLLGIGLTGLATRRRRAS